jgi:uncharacterized protein (TIGR02301 family)
VPLPRIDVIRVPMMSRDLDRLTCTALPTRRVNVRLLACVLVFSVFAAPVQAASDVKPYDDKLMRLSEILGAVHYLRELCGANEGQYWRDRMRELTDAEGTSALRRAKLARAFNQGYRSYSRTYNTCSPSAQTAITRFLGEGTQISEGLIKGPQ